MTTKPKEAEPAKRGRPRIERDEKIAAQVLTMTGFNIPANAIYEMLELDRATVQRLYGREMRIGKTTVAVNAGRKTYQLAMQGNVRCLELILKCVCGWVEPARAAREVIYVGQRERDEAAARAPVTQSDWAGLLAEAPDDTPPARRGRLQ